MRSLWLASPLYSSPPASPVRKLPDCSPAPTAQSGAAGDTIRLPRKHGAGPSGSSMSAMSSSRPAAQQHTLAAPNGAASAPTSIPAPSRHRSR